MRSLILILFSFALMTSCMTPEVAVQNSTKFKGIKKIKTNVYDVENRDGRIVKAAPTRDYPYSSNQISTYDRNGQLTSVTELGTDGKISSETGYRYNASIDQLEEIYTIDAQKDSTTFTYRYSTKGYPIARQTRKDGAIVNTTDYLYDEQNRVVEAKSFDLMSTDYETVETVYRDAGKTIASFYDDNNKLVKKEITTVSMDGNKTDVTTYNSENEPLETITHTRDDRGNVVRRTSYTHENDDFIDISITYNAQEEEVERTVFNSKEGRFYNWTMEHQQSSKGDWIQKIVRKDDQSIFMVQRQIEYYYLTK